MDIASLRKHEGETWGATDRASPIRVEVLNANLGRRIAAKRIESGKPVFEQPAYVLFPAQSETPGSIYKGGSFDLRFTLPKNLADDLDAALRHWISLGGLGSRTRRGCGALYCAEYAGAKWCNPADLMSPTAPARWPVLKGSRVIAGPAMGWHEAWIEAVQVLRDYRQQRTRDRGRSLWPEPDAIRRLRQRRSLRHSQDVTTGDFFPRSTLGLPIIFHFKDSRDGDPADNSLLVDQEVDRMASPVIVKAMALDERQAVPVIVALAAPRAPSLLLRQAHAADLPVEPGSMDVIGGLLDRARQRWGGQVFPL
jgi:CRISPR-associated protein Cmr1